MRYFAFGSNMLSARLRARVGELSAGVAGEVTGHQLRFHKRSGDGSAKCDAHQTENPNDVVHGVVYHISAAQQVLLDSFEGKGYSRRKIPVNVNGDRVVAYMYVADPDYVDPDLAPYHWYKQFVIAGAKEFALPKHYVRTISKVPTVTDPDSERHLRNMALLSNGGYIATTEQSLP
jgi:hypothetical protein